MKLRNLILGKVSEKKNENETTGNPLKVEDSF